jgi:flagellar biosynthetic protein FliO
MIKYYTPGLEKLFIIGILCVISYILFKKILKKETRQRSEIKIVSVIPVGKKEKLVVCQIQNKKFIMGVTQHNISHLHTFESGEVSVTAPAEPPKNNYTPYFT